MSGSHLESRGVDSLPQLLEDDKDEVQYRVMICRPVSENL